MIYLLFLSPCAQPTSSWPDAGRQATRESVSHRFCIALLLLDLERTGRLELPQTGREKFRRGRAWGRDYSCVIELKCPTLSSPAPTERLN